jgi:hypothetical protein
MDIKDLEAAFVELTNEALAEEDRDKLIESLLVREPFRSDLINHRVRLDADVARELLSKEGRVLEKLEAARAEILKEMDRLSKNRHAAKAYSSKFPFPSVPVFFDKSE